MAEVRDSSRTGEAWLQSRAPSHQLSGRPHRRRTSAQGPTPVTGNPSATRLHPASDPSQVTGGAEDVTVGPGAWGEGELATPRERPAHGPSPCLLCIWFPLGSAARACFFHLMVNILAALFSALLGSAEHTSDAAGNWRGPRRSNLLNTGFCAQKHITALGAVTQVHRGQPGSELCVSERRDRGEGAQERGPGGGRSPEVCTAKGTPGLTPTVTLSLGLR